MYAAGGIAENRAVADARESAAQSKAVTAAQAYGTIMGDNRAPAEAGGGGVGKNTIQSAAVNLAIIQHF